MKDSLKGCFLFLGICLDKDIKGLIRREKFGAENLKRQYNIISN